MSKGKKHNGERKSRRNHASRTPNLGYYLIFTDTEETEAQFFKGLRDSLPKEVQKHLIIKVFPKVETKSLISRCIEELDKDPQYRIPWIVLDRDEVKNFDSIINEAQNKEINTGWSNPCFEIWLHAYFEKPPISETSVQCCEKFSKIFKKAVGYEYDKSDTSMYRHLKEHGDEEKAIQRCKQRLGSIHPSSSTAAPSSLYSTTTVYELVEEINRKANTC
ncbi:MAG: RloB domain-containing protein [Spirochaetia bacterium]|nr:RloB domain-containing protein [Spirochaetia bacterium]